MILAESSDTDLALFTDNGVSEVDIIRVDDQDWLGLSVEVSLLIASVLHLVEMYIAAGLSPVYCSRQWR